ncbi:MAG: DUF7487 domain-containing protein [Nitrososphaerales archaeon]
MLSTDYKNVTKYLKYRCSCSNDTEMITLNGILAGNKCSKCHTERRKINSQRKFGTYHPMQSKEVQDKSKETCRERYGCDYSFQSKEVQDKSKETCRERYGCDYSFQSKEVREKGIETCRKRYGTDHPMQNPEIRDKTRETCLERYGYGCPFPNEGVKEKILETLRERYGADHPMQNKDVLDRALKASHRTKTIILPSELTVHVQGYEPFYIQKLLRDGFSDEIIVATVEDVKDLEIYYELDCKRRRYRPDFYFKDRNLIIEIKSTYTFQVDEEKNMLKFFACCYAGYDVEIWIYDKTGTPVQFVVSDLNRFSELRTRIV